jgi:hypothetical protein
MEFIKGHKYDYDLRDSVNNPNIFHGFTSKGKLIFELSTGAVLTYTKEQADENFTPVLTYPPCDLSEAEPGDEVEDHRGEKDTVDHISRDRVYPIEGNNSRSWRMNGYYYSNELDSSRNARRLIKHRPKEIELIALSDSPIAKSNNFSQISDKLNELISAVNELRKEK